jgi:hypothetical protein
MISMLITFGVIAIGSFGAAWFMQGRVNGGQPFGKLAGVDVRYWIGGALAVASSMLAMVFPPLGLAAIGAAGAAVGSAAADKRVERDQAGGGQSQLFAL